MIQLANTSLVNGARTWVADSIASLTPSPAPTGQKILDGDICLLNAAAGANAYQTWIYKVGIDNWTLYIDSALIKAVLSEMISGVDNTKYTTPQAVRQAIQSGLAFIFFIGSNAGGVNYILALDYGQTFDALSDDQDYWVLFNQSSLGGDTAQFTTTTGLTGALPIVKFDGLGNYIAIAANDIIANGTYKIVMDTGHGRIIMQDLRVINNLEVSQGANQPCDKVTLNATGTLVVNNTLVTANSKIILTYNVLGGVQTTLSAPDTSYVPGTSFTIKSGAADSSTVNYLILNT